MNNALKLVSVNIELDRHLDQVKTFFQKEQPDVLCLQEVFRSDFVKLQEEFGVKGFFASMGNYCLESEKGCREMGIALLSKLSLQGVQKAYYSGDEHSVDKLNIETEDDGQKYYHVFLWGKAQKEQREFTLGTTHFTWSPNGQADDVQREHLRKFLQILGGIGEIVFCGDFNAPRGREIFSAISAHYTDNIPPGYTTSIDAKLHRKGDLQLMVDGLFSTPSYRCDDVRLVKGVSDHLGIAAEITKE